jgi:hypothetical protein
MKGRHRASNRMGGHSDDGTQRGASTLRWNGTMFLMALSGLSATVCPFVRFRAKLTWGAAASGSSPPLMTRCGRKLVRNPALQRAPDLILANPVCFQPWLGAANAIQSIEAARVHHPHRRCCCGVPVRGTRPAAGHTCDRIYQWRVGRGFSTLCRGFPQRRQTAMTRVA